jgi:hypothetical protein
MNRRRALTTAALAAGLLAVAACGDRPGYDRDAVESYLVESQGATFAPSGTVEKATCPAGLELREGMRFTCRLTVSGARVPYRVRLTHVHDDRVSVTASPDGVLVSGTKLTEAVRGRLPKASAAADVDCGGPYFVAAVGDTVDCTLVLGGQEKPIKVTVEDESGSVSVVA